MEGFIKQTIVVEVECETQFSTGERMVVGLLKNPSVPTLGYIAITSVKVLSCTGPKSDGTITFNDLQIGDRFRFMHDAEHVIQLKTQRMSKPGDLGTNYVTVIGSHPGYPQFCHEFVPVEKI